MKETKTKKRQTKIIGKLGEDIACQYLDRSNFKIIERNFLRKCGEIDIVAQKEKVLYFVEVKSVTCKTKVSQMSLQEEYRPEENIHKAKIARLRRVVQIYIKEKGIKDSEWRFMVIIVRLNMQTRRAKVAVLDDVL